MLIYFYLKELVEIAMMDKTTDVKRMLEGFLSISNIEYSVVNDIIKMQYSTS